MLVLTSQNENFANVVLESLSVGTPVLESNRVGLSDYIEKNEFGWVVKLNIDSIVEALNDAYFQREKREKIRKEAPQKVREDFMPQKIALQYINAYENLVIGGNKVND